MKIAIHQPNFLPWPGYFAKMRACDIFVLLDDAQMPGGQSYVYRTAIKDRDRALWLSVPTRRGLETPIAEVRFGGDGKWPAKHLQTLKTIYGRLPHFGEIFPLLEEVYRSPGELLAEFNIRLIKSVAGYLGLSCRFVRSSSLPISGAGDDRLIALCRALGGTAYLSGKGGQNYQDPAKFAAAGIALDVRVYRPVEYSQPNPPFLPGLSIVDGLFNLGRTAAGLLVYAGAESADPCETDEVTP